MQNHDVSSYCSADFGTKNSVPSFQNLFVKDHLDALESKRLRAVGSESQQPKLGIKWQSGQEDQSFGCILIL